jgi:catechol 2,3-dioxygenase-like lactoylglutathione lyase family enzyme
MENIIANLVGRFERGTLTRRELVRGLTMLSAGGAAVSGVQAQDVTIKVTKIDHVSIQVNDLPRSVAFYENVFGLVVIGEDKPNEVVRLGIDPSLGSARGTLVSLHHKSPAGIVDHFGIGVGKFNKEAVIAELKRRGATPEDSVDAGFHVLDPDGVSVQLMAT